LTNWTVQFVFEVEAGDDPVSAAREAQRLIASDDTAPVAAVWTGDDLSAAPAGALVVDLGLGTVLERPATEDESAARWESFVDAVRATVAREAPDDEAVAVVFATVEYDEGFMVGSSGFVLFADRSTDDIVHCEGVDELSREVIGVVGRKFGLGVDLRTGDVDDAECIDTLYDKYGYPFPGRR